MDPMAGERGLLRLRSASERFVEPALTIESLKDVTVLEIGSGSGRVVNMLLDVGVREVIAVEPSLAFEVLKKNTHRRSSRIRYLNLAGGPDPGG